MDNQQIATTIANQMGGCQRLSLMVNAKNIIALEEGGLCFRFMKGSKKINAVKIILDKATDTYTVRFIWVRGLNWNDVKEFTGIYCDQLISLFESETQLELTI
jgi:hypothetical protein